MIHNQTLDHSFHLSATSRRIFEALWGRDALAEHPNLRSSLSFEYLRVHPERHCEEFPEIRHDSDTFPERRVSGSTERRHNARRHPHPPKEFFMTTTTRYSAFGNSPAFSDMLDLCSERPLARPRLRTSLPLAGSSASLWDLTVRLFRADDDSEHALARLESKPRAAIASPKDAAISRTSVAAIAIPTDNPSHRLPQRYVRYALAVIGAPSASLPPGDDPDPKSQSKPLSKLYGKLLPERRARPRSEPLDHDKSHPLTRIFSKHWPERRKSPRSVAP